MKQKYYIFLLLVLVGIVLAFQNPGVVKASLSAFVRQDCYTSSSTSSPAYQTPGTGTSTVTCNLGGDGADKAVVNIVVNASSTASIWNIYVEESMDGQDWFPVSPNQRASTTNPFNLNAAGYASFAFASSTVGGSVGGTNSVGVNGTNNRNHYTLEVPVRMKRVRVYSGVTGGNGSTWMQIVPKAQI